MQSPYLQTWPILVSVAGAGWFFAEGAMKKTVELSVIISENIAEYKYKHRLTIQHPPDTLHGDVLGWWLYF